MAADPVTGLGKPLNTSGGRDPVPGSCRFMLATAASSCTATSESQSVFVVAGERLKLVTLAPAGACCCLLGTLPAHAAVDAYYLARYVPLRPSQCQLLRLYSTAVGLSSRYSQRLHYLDRRMHSSEASRQWCTLRHT
jgi:hypothetical protein